MDFLFRQKLARTRGSGNTFDVMMAASTCAIAAIGAVTILQPALTDSTKNALQIQTNSVTGVNQVQALANQVEVTHSELEGNFTPEAIPVGGQLNCLSGQGANYTCFAPVSLNPEDLQSIMQSQNVSMDVAASLGARATSEQFQRYLSANASSETNAILNELLVSQNQFFESLNSYQSLCSGRRLDATTARTCMGLRTQLNRRRQAFQAFANRFNTRLNQESTLNPSAIELIGNYFLAVADFLAPGSGGKVVVFVRGSGGHFTRREITLGGGRTGETMSVESTPGQAFTTAISGEE
ncbi:MAG: hypothetical protein K2X01_02685 [Cyanobacteria bacterium]|nr:hypothetical protein [Cyanobacteriota bacterium]